MFSLIISLYTTMEVLETIVQLKITSFKNETSVLFNF